MFEELFKVFDIPLVCVVIGLSFFSILIIKNFFNVFLSLFVNLFLVIFISSIVLTQQVNLGEFLVVSSFFIVAIVFFMFSLDYNYDEPIFDDDTNPKIALAKNIFVIIFFILSFFLFGLNFLKIDFTTTIPTNKSIVLNDSNKVENTEKDEGNVEYVENISLLNQNKLFQRFTHIVMFYICIVFVLFFFNKKGELDEG